MMFYPRDGKELVQKLYTTFLLTVAWELVFCGLAADGVLSADPSQDCHLQHSEITNPEILLEHDKDIWEATQADINSPLKHSSKILLKLRWRERTVKLRLRSHKISTFNAVVEWTENNSTIAETLVGTCFYQGHVIGKEHLTLALSACEGLRGLFNTENETVYIQPLTEENDITNKHMLYTCLPQTHQADREDPLDVLKANLMFRHSRRTRRSVSKRKKILEVLVVADTGVVNHVGSSKAKMYIMTLMNIANMVYQHPSLNANIEIVTVRIILLQKREEQSMITANNPYDTIYRLCTWAKALYTSGPYRGKKKHDVAVLLTRKKFGPAGYAPITGMCNPERSCAVVQEEGFTSAFVIAHEMAHIFGLVHDGKRNRCTGEKYKTAIMAATVQSSIHNTWWSDCSRDQMRRVIHYATCLEDEPNEEDLPAIEVPKPLGISWPLDKQCSQEFGQQFSLCRAFNSDPCLMLWCSEKRNPALCRTKWGTPLPGTTCAYQTDWMCDDGKCKYLGNQRPLDGEWSSWTHWSTCSRECGVGIKTRTRKCDDPRPKYGGKTCTGASTNVDTCKAAECKRPYRDWREQQCEVFDMVRSRGGKHNWMPYQLDTTNATQLCMLTCVSRHSGEIMETGLSVEDGVQCSYEKKHNICINGKCMDVGCDGIIGSGKAYDSCGFCGGDGSQCETVGGDYKGKIPRDSRDYIKIAVIPEGARDIEVKEVEGSPNFLALKAMESSEFFLNGGRRQEREADIVQDGLRFRYEKQVWKETIAAAGPTPVQLGIMLYPKNYKYTIGIKYKYVVKKSDRAKELYRWKFKVWSECSVSCGTGKQYIIYGCFNKEKSEFVDDEECESLKPPRNDTAPCKRSVCNNVEVFRYVMSNKFSPCSETCGENGIQEEEVSCERETAEGVIYPVPVERCNHLPYPNETRPCNRKACFQEWAAGEWSKCSKTCGAGVNIREVICGDPTTKEDDDLCPGTKPVTHKICLTKKCPRGRPTRCQGDKSRICKRVSARRCKRRNFQKWCCESCAKYTTDFSKSRRRRYHRRWRG